MLVLSFGLFASSIVGPKEIMSIFGQLVPKIPHSNLAWQATTLGFEPFCFS